MSFPPGDLRGGHRNLLALECDTAGALTFGYGPPALFMLTQVRPPSSAACRPHAAGRQAAVDLPVTQSWLGGLPSTPAVLATTRGWSYTYTLYLILIPYTYIYTL